MKIHRIQSYSSILMALILCRQLIMLADVYQGSEVSDHICPIALTLGADRVDEVRQISYKLVSTTCFITTF